MGNADAQRRTASDDEYERAVADEEASFAVYDSMALAGKSIPAHMEAELATIGGLNFIVVLSVISSHFWWGSGIRTHFGYAARRTRQHLLAC